ncbi:Kynurenine formamidase [Exophiala dermatitidis]|uniref:Arylformamidase n=1 Tax=Exophiala dermatitidis (strain ATCC 34100 / CBS 525.76 / NIH/UT8656) TaxID=858893 RepID=H6BQM8_EXODN|nr:uncharacterized protein HMPREF1120_02026 [Exophiala dermatitidis NIH/UT8656]KAJ4515793.1 Kynurenine formamidase [Exophiala dermatitidis]EHY53845.1 hypothetical protein HMPREF1120_02026 [Exophiala dermatitidis NIH/UT8656]KAJ4519487.1 Kynurenine formamidase [Exophiala dermatitidis]KAJ4529304.1 Kynurenine formamidase [Exophiala dermatitidis]KAJ4544043.1 Kynurenine formamidase [Exophiala dermatitidis]
MRKFIRYLQDQAVQASEQRHSGAAYLSPATKEPQQREHHHTPSQFKAQHTAHHQTRAGHPSTAAHSFPAHTSAGGPPSPPQPRNSNGQRETPSPDIPDPLHRNITRHQYAMDNILQSYEIYIPEADTSHHGRRHSNAPKQKYWVVYIHGGYFRDPSVTSASFYPALSQLVYSSDHHHLHLPHIHNPFEHQRHHEDEDGQEHVTNPFSDPRHRYGELHDSHDSDIEDGHDDEDIRPYIAGYASINYRLSPHHQKAPQDPTKTPKYELRDARWPDHIHDVVQAIAHLQQKYGFGENYLLVGHSVGATMAVLSTLSRGKTFTSGTKAASATPAQGGKSSKGRRKIRFGKAKKGNTESKNDDKGSNGTSDSDRSSNSSGDEHPASTSSSFADIDPPLAVLGVSGIYDFEYLHKTFPSYIELTRNAIPNSEDFALASPAWYSADEYAELWAGGGAGTGTKLPSEAGSGNGPQTDRRQGRRTQAQSRALILAHSHDDGLVDWSQVEAMERVFTPRGNTVTDDGNDNKISVETLEIKGQHNDIWEQGTELARAIRHGVRVMRRLDSQHDDDNDNNAQ